MFKINYAYDQKKGKEIINNTGMPRSESYKSYRYQNIRGAYEHISYNKLKSWKNGQMPKKLQTTETKRRKNRNPNCPFVIKK